MNGKQVMEAYQGGVKVYPEEEELVPDGRYVVKLAGSWYRVYENSEYEEQLLMGAISMGSYHYVTHQRTTGARCMLTAVSDAPMRIVSGGSSFWDLWYLNPPHVPNSPIQYRVEPELELRTSKSNQQVWMSYSIAAACSAPPYYFYRPYFSSFKPDKPESDQIWTNIQGVRCDVPYYNMANRVVAHAVGDARITCHYRASGYVASGLESRYVVPCNGHSASHEYFLGFSPFTEVVYSNCPEYTGQRDFASLPPTEEAPTWAKRPTAGWDR